ncbi:MAG TPA: beta-ketoacyl-ACP synthase II [Caldisericia bacterium]|nr:beta-ketoacyl-ACP synthase II [Caldisericia bacterium]HPF49201.1 beta-ketoacyl-ACP synthase II [Caldisericia bacterium]HPI84120.1 beta-ketoacyl-ACP synthase II [Caldisericia bacterium]HPQ93377.1 beta-ketoacyl-ACP synthase II [Caldisericia bacterium]HRV75241.1 beta-ketoacyl-ACP synthase II [Caldisericia bacterium]
MMKRVVVTGVGLLTPIGTGREEFWNSLMEGKSGVSTIEGYDISGLKATIGAQIKNFDPNKYVDPKEVSRTDPVTQYAIAAADLAVEDSGIDFASTDRDRVGTLISTGIGGLQTIEKNILVMADKGARRVSPLFIPMMIANMPSAQVSIKYGLRGPSSNVVTACATSNYAVGEAAEMIKRGDADIMLAGGAEASLIPLGIAGFANMRALSTRNDEPEKASRPFDKDRDGFVMGEGGVVLVLEEFETAKARGANVYCEVLSVGYSTDAYHITAPDPEGWGAIKCMSVAMEKAGITLDQIDYINAHGTSTPLNDKGEAIAIMKFFGDKVSRVSVNSTKSMVGHLLGAAGAVEAAAVALQIKNQTVHRSLNFNEPDPDIDFKLNIPKNTEKREIRYALSNSFGFGGHNCTLAFGRVD